MPPVAPPTPVVVVIDAGDDAVHTHTVLAAHHVPSGRITLHPGPGTTSETGLAHDLLAALGKPPLLPGHFPAGRQPAWEAATAWITALPVTWLEEPGRPADRWLTLPALDRLVSYDSPAPCTVLCAPPVTFRHRPSPTPLTQQTAREAARRLAAATAHPCLAAALAAGFFTGVSFQNSLLPARATTRTLRPLWLCTTVPAIPTAELPARCRRGRASF